MGRWQNKSGKVYDYRLTKSIDLFLDKMLDIYPRRYIVYLNRDYPAHSDNSKRLFRSCGYEDRIDFFDDYGFTYIDINKINIYKLDKDSDLYKTIQECNEKRNLLKNTAYKIDYDGVNKNPIEKYYYDGHWNPDKELLKVNISPYNQVIIDKFFDKLYSLYPNRIVYKFESLYRHFYEDYYHKVRMILLGDKKGDIFEAFGFAHTVLIDENRSRKHIYSSLEMEKNVETVSFDKVFENGNWKSLSGKNVNTKFKDTLNFVCSTVLAYFPKRIIKKISDLYQYISYSSFNNLSKALNYNNMKEFLSDFGFVFVEYLEIEINKPLFIYSPDKEFLYKVNSNDRKIFVDKNTKYIWEHAFEDLPLEVLDLSYCNDNQVIIKKGAFYNCSKIDYIININSVKKIEENAFINCNNKASNDLFDEINNFLGKSNISLKKYNLYNEVTKYNSFILSVNDYERFQVVNIDGLTNATILDISSIVDNDYFKIDEVNIVGTGVYSFNALNFDRENNIKENTEYSFPSKYLEIYKNYINDDYYKKTIDNEIDLIIENYDFNNEKDYYIEFVDEVEENKSIVHCSDFISENIKNLIDSDKCINCYTKDEAIAFLNENGKFIENLNYICNDFYIKTFLKIHNLTPYAFINSDILMGNKDFLIKLFELYPYMDVTVINKKFLNDKKFVRRISKFLTSKYMLDKLKKL